MAELDLFVDGMSSRRLVREVTARLRDVPGVETLSAHSGDRVVRLTGSMKEEDVLEAFAGTTFRAEVVDTRSQESE